MRVSPEPITSLEMLFIRACHMSILPSPDTLIKSVLENGSDRTMRIYNLDRKSSLKTTEKVEIIGDPDSEIENTQLDRSVESSGISAVEEILDIFPGATVKI